MMGQISVFWRFSFIFAVVSQVSPLTLYYYEPSPGVRSVDLVIHALGLTAEYKTVDLMKREQFSPEHLKMNPLHTVPVIDDDGFILWESRAIMAYLVSKYGKEDSLYPKDLQKRAIVDQRLHYSNDVFFILKQSIKTLYMKKPLTSEHAENINEALDNIEKLLAGQDFMAGDTLTLADYSYINLVDLLKVLHPTPAGKYPLTEAWEARCQSSMKEFDKVNKKGRQIFEDVLRELLHPTAQ